MIKDKVFRVILVASLVFLTFQFGFRPIFFRDKNDIKANRDYWIGLLPKDSSYDYDVIVFGSEPQGIAAAVSSARLGARTLLISDDQDMGGCISRCLIPELEIPVDTNKRMLNEGLLGELSKKTGDYFSAELYISAVKELLETEKDLNVIAGSSINSITMKGNRIESVEVLTGDKLMEVSAKMYIDASDDGALLDYSGVPYFKGSADINLEDIYMPVSLNFEMAPEGSAGSADSINKIGRVVYSNELVKYIPGHKDIRLDNIAIHFLQDNKVVVSGLQIAGVDTLDSRELKQAYGIAVKEAENLSRHLSQTFVELKDYTLSRAAEDLRIHESKHYKGRYLLTVGDIINGRYFEDTAAMGSYPVMISKLAARGTHIAGSADRYSIPLRCLVPDEVQNLFMAGPRASYSSLASTSAGTIGTSIAAGEAVGAAAVLFIARNESPVFLDEGYEYLNEFKSALKEKGMKLPDKASSFKFRNNWAGESAQQLISLGLLAGGTENDMKYDQQASQKDLAYILMNGIYRLDSEKYSQDLHERLKPFINDDSLTFDSMMRMLGALYDVQGEPDVIYASLCDKQRINGVFDKKLGKLQTNAEIITMDMVYYIGAYSIRSYTGKNTALTDIRYLSASEPGEQHP